MTATNPDARLLELAELLAGAIRTAIDAFDELEVMARENKVHDECQRGTEIMDASQSILDEMLDCKPSTFGGFQALEMAQLWERGEWPGMPRS